MKSSSPRGWQANLPSLLLGLVLLLAAGLRFYALGASSLWSDEGNSWALVSRSFAQIARDAAADIHPPGYYWLLKLWTMPFGASAVGMRSFSALAGVLLVYIVYRLGLLLWPPPTPAHQQPALLAALLVAVNPFLVYYSQEARMYLLLALASAALFWGVLAWFTGKDRWGWALVGYGIAAVVGLWTHYTFPVVMAAAGCGYLLLSLATPRALHTTWRPFMVTNLLVILAYVPWLPTAIDRLLHWPAPTALATPAEGVPLIIQTLLLGPLRTWPQPLGPWLLAAALLPFVGLVLTWRQPRLRPIALWWLAPILLSVGAGLLTDAFLKFLLVGAPAWALLSAAASTSLPRRAPLALVIGGGALLFAWLVLPAYYRAPDARDNYQGVAHYVATVADPAQDLVLLDAPGQQEVWRYYDPGLPILALPQQRPPDETATEATLAAATKERRTIYALFWATDEADPERIVESWLGQHAFQGLESWQGNLRFVTYSLPTDLACAPVMPALTFGTQIQLTARCQMASQTTVAAGDVFLLGLQWQTVTPVTERYKVTLQLLDATNQVIAQRDSEPGGGTAPTAGWQPAIAVQDNHGLAIPVGTPPGSYRLIIALYDAQSGARLPVAGADHYVLGEVMVVRSERPFPVDLLPVQHRLDRKLGPVRLVGYSAHRRGMGHAPQTPLAPGDPVEVTLLWQAPDPLPRDWPPDLTFTLTLGNARVTSGLAGGTYPTGHWQAGEIVRAKIEAPYTGEETRPTLQIGAQELRLAPLPHRP